MLARRSSVKFLFIAVFIVTIFAIYATHDSWDSSRLGFEASQFTYWPISTALHEELQENLAPTEAIEPIVVDIEPTKNLRSLCDQTSWTDGLWIQCHSNARRDSEGKRSVHGGLNNVRNRLQTCLRVAIDSGAGVIMPTVATRNQTQLKDLGGGAPVPASTFWNMEYMVEALEKQCPQLQVRFDMKGIETQMKAPRRHFREARYQNGTFGDMTLDVLREGGIELSSIKRGNPVAIAFGDTFLAWDYEKSGELSTVRKDLYRTLKYNQTLLDISSGILQAPALQKGFIGIHLRAETDWPSSFGKAKDQMRLYIEEIESLERKDSSDLRTLYVSCGSQDGIHRFRKRVTPLGYEVHDKWTLLSEDPETLARVENLMFDEKAIIEYQMLLNADFFLGPVMSSMSSLIAFSRALDSQEEFFPTYIFPGSEKDVGEDGWGLRRTYEQVPMMKGDKRSRLMVVNGEDIMSLFP
jgi:hypothetical protein